MAERWFGLLVRLFPRHFRAHYEQTLLETLARRWVDARGRRAGFVLRESAGLLRSAAAEWKLARRRGGAGHGPGLRAALRSPLRELRRHPLYSVACVFTLALAVAAAASSIAVAKSAFLDPLPYADDGELVTLFTSTETWPDGPVSAHVFEDLRAAEAPFSSYAPMDPAGVAYSDGGSAQSVGAILVTPEFFETLGVRPSLGRVWADGERDAAVLSWGFWQTTLGADPAVLGRRIVIDGTERTVVGVMGAGFVPPFWPQAGLLLPLDVADLVATTQRAARPLSLIVRRADGVSTTQVNAFLQSFSAQLQQDHPRAHGENSWHVVPLRDFLVGDARPALLGGGAAAALLLLIVGANIAGLSAARAIAERHQTAVQLALGASRAHLLRERIFAALALSAVGALAGLWLAYMVVSTLTTVQPQFLQRIPRVSLDPGAALVAGGLGLLWGVLATVLPHGAALAAPAASLTATRGATLGAGVTRVRSGLVALQVATALVLVVGAGLLVRTLRHLSDTALGFEPAGLVTMSVSLPGERYAERDAQIALERAVVERLEGIEGVTAATASVGVPVIGGGRAGLRVYGRTDDAARGEVAYFALAPEFIATTGMRVLEGRGLEPTDRSGAPDVVVINEAAARRFWPEGGAVGSRVRLGPDVEENDWATVVGIVADIRQHGPVESVLPTAFAPTWQMTVAQRWFTVRAPSPPPELGARMRAALHEIEPAAAIARVASLDELISDTTSRQRLVLMALAFYGFVATVLCAFGVYAVVSLTSRLRRREYAIRMAIGAPRQVVRWLVLRQALVLAAIGAGVGLTLAAGGTRVLQGLLHGVAPLDPITFAGSAFAVLTLAALSAWWPARRAGLVDPAETLKE